MENREFKCKHLLTSLRLYVKAFFQVAIYMYVLKVRKMSAKIVPALKKEGGENDTFICLFPLIIWNDTNMMIQFALLKSSPFDSKKVTLVKSPPPAKP